jgi:hypothetical protein
MKNRITLMQVIFLLSITNVVLAQRNANQQLFKSKSIYNYNNSDMNLNRQKDDFAMATTGNISSDMQYANENEVLLEVRSLANVKADRFLAVFNLTQIGETAIQTDELINSRIVSFTNSVKSLGISEENIYIDMIYLIPTFEYAVEKKLFSKSYNEVPAGFEMQKNIHISFNNIDRVDDMVTMAAKNEIYDLVKLDFFVDNTEGIRDTLRERSVKYLDKKIKSFDQLDIKLNDHYHTFRESSYTIYPESQYSDYDAFVSQSVEAVKKNTGVTSIRKPSTVAYDQIPYNTFDVIINPGILTPVVQYVYTLHVKYTLDKPDGESKYNYLLVTPNGDIKPIEVH